MSSYDLHMTSVIINWLHTGRISGKSLLDLCKAACGNEGVINAFGLGLRFAISFAFQGTKYILRNIRTAVEQKVLCCFWLLDVSTVWAHLKTVCIHWHHFRQIDSLPGCLGVHMPVCLNPAKGGTFERRCRRRDGTGCRQWHCLAWGLAPPKVTKMAQKCSIWGMEVVRLAGSGCDQQYQQDSWRDHLAYEIHPQSLSLPGRSCETTTVNTPSFLLAAPAPTRDDIDGQNDEV